MKKRFYTNEYIRRLRKENQLYRNSIKGANVGLWEWDILTGEQIINERWASMLGFTIKELLPITINTFRDHLHPDDLQMVDEEIGESLQNGKTSYTICFRMIHKEGHIIWVESTGAVIDSSPDGIPRLMSGSHIDITEKKMAEEAVKDNQRRLTATQRIAHIGNWELDIKTNELWASEEARNIYGFDPGIDHFDFAIAQRAATSSYRKILDRALVDLIKNNKPYDVEFKINNMADGREVSIRSIAELETDAKGNPLRVIGTIQDITGERKRQEELIRLGYHDQLTGLYNRRFFIDEISHLDKHSNYPLTVIFCDVNGLKIVNDSFGHGLGDELLIKVADILTGSCRTGDIVARYGGDEFALILPRTNKDDAEKIIRRYKESFAQEKVGAFDVSVAFGYATMSDNSQEIMNTIKLAEDKMHSNKLCEGRSMRSKTVDLIINTLYEKNNREMLHSKRVSQLCESFARYLGMNKEDVALVRTAGLMHDIGKIGIDENILNKAGKLTDLEYKEIKRHSEIGFRILSSVNEFSQVAEYVLHHQEKWDGTGYPKGLKGDRISSGARIIAIADAYDAMTGPRTYCTVKSNKEALAEIKACAGSHFDPRLAIAFVEMLDK